MTVYEPAMGTGAFLGNARAVFGGVNQTDIKAAKRIEAQTTEANENAAKYLNHPPASKPKPKATPTPKETLTGEKELPGSGGF